MDEYIYQEHEVADGTHILVYKLLEGSYMFERKIFVPVSEYHPDSIVTVLTSQFRPLFSGSREMVWDWLRHNRENEEIKMVGIGKDFQLLSISEFLYHHD